MTLSGGVGGANTHVSGERKFSPLSSAHMLWCPVLIVILFLNGLRVFMIKIPLRLLLLRAPLFLQSRPRDIKCCTLKSSSFCFPDPFCSLLPKSSCLLSVNTMDKNGKKAKRISLHSVVVL